MSHRKQRDGRFKAQVALEAIKNQQTISQIASEYGVNPAQVSQWNLDLSHSINIPILWIENLDSMSSISVTC